MNSLNYLNKSVLIFDPKNKEIIIFNENSLYNIFAIGMSPLNCHNFNIIFIVKISWNERTFCYQFRIVLL